MEKLEIVYLRTLLRVRKWANTSNGERIICSAVGVCVLMLAVCTMLLTTGIVLNYLQ